MSRSHPAPGGWERPHCLIFRQLLALAAQVVQQGLPLFPGKVRHLAALGVQEQIQAFGGGGFHGWLRPGLAG